MNSFSLLLATHLHVQRMKLDEINFKRICCTSKNHSANLHSVFFFGLVHEDIKEIRTNCQNMEISIK